MLLQELDLMTLKKMYANAHKAIRANPEHKKRESKPKPEKQKKDGTERK